MFARKVLRGRGVVPQTKTVMVAVQTSHPAECIYGVCLLIMQYSKIKEVFFVMKNFVSLFTDSAKEFKSVLAIAVTGMLIALSYILESFTIPLGNSKINFAYIAIAVIGMLYGPTISFFAGGICDAVGFLAYPQGGFLPIFTLIAMLQGVIYGILLYKKTPKKLVLSAIIARVADVLIINMVINTYACIHYGYVASQSLKVIISTRLVKNLIQLCADIPILLAVLPACLIAYSAITVRGKRKAA